MDDMPNWSDEQLAQHIVEVRTKRAAEKKQESTEATAEEWRAGMLDEGDTSQNDAHKATNPDFDYAKQDKKRKAISVDAGTEHSELDQDTTNSNGKKKKKRKPNKATVVKISIEKARSLLFTTAYHALVEEKYSKADEERAINVVGFDTSDLVPCKRSTTLFGLDNEVIFTKNVQEHVKVALRQNEIIAAGKDKSKDPGSRPSKDEVQSAQKTLKMEIQSIQWALVWRVRDEDKEGLRKMIREVVEMREEGQSTDAADMDAW